MIGCHDQAAGNNRDTPNRPLPIIPIIPIILTKPTCTTFSPYFTACSMIPVYIA